MPKKKKKSETQEVGKYINPFTDFGFKKIFLGQQHHLTKLPNITNSN